MDIPGALDSLRNTGFTRKFPIKDITDTRRALGADYEEKAEILIAQQYRVFCREEWRMASVDSLIELHEGEPLPFELPEIATLSGYARIGFLEHNNSPVVLKMNYLDDSAAFRHIQTEFESLRKIESHHHLAKAIKAFVRTRNNQKEMGVILARADCTLVSFMNELYFDGDYSPPQPRYINKDLSHAPRHYKHDRDWARLVLLNSFGCLSHSLYHIHKSNLRHKDIKPDNVLVKYKTCNFDEETIVLADFGSAHYFGDTGRSVTDSDRRAFRQMWSAPEVAEALRRSPQNSPRESAYQNTAQATERGAKGLPKFEHGLPEDVYSLGLVFLEVLSARNLTTNTAPFH